MKTEKIEQSEFNEAISFLNRLNYIFYSLLEAKQNHDLELWSTALINLFSELINDLKKDEIEKYKKELKEIVDENNQQRKNMLKRGKIEIPQSLYWKILNFEIKLREIYNRSGYQTKRKDDAYDALR